MEAWLEKPDGERIQIQEKCALGRSRSNQVVLPDARVSRRHADIQPQGDNEYWIVDFGSANGTCVSGRRIAQPTRLRDGDEILIAGSSFIFRQPGGEKRQDDASVTSLTICEVQTIQSWLLLTDIVNSTRLVQSAEPEKLPVVVGTWFSSCRDIVETTRGTVYQFLGDGLMVYWEHRADTAGRVVDALRRFGGLQQSSPLAFRVVLHFGRVTRGGVAAGPDTALMGGDMHYTFRMEKLAGSLGLGIMLSAAAAERLGDTLPLKPIGQHSLSGFDHSHEFFGLATPGDVPAPE